MERKLLLGNSAAAEAALVSGVEVVTGYPGTPSTEVIEHLSEVVIKNSYSTYVEWSNNEKVAMDVAVASAWSGKRTMVTMKMAGLNVASDTLLNIVHKGVKGGFVVYVADDPGTHAGCTEQDSRFYGLMGHIPVFEPSSPADTYRMVRDAFEFSEKLHIPIIVRTTTNVSHTIGVVECGEHTFRDTEFGFKKNISVYTTVRAPRAKQHQELIDKLTTLGAELETAGYNPLTLKGKVGVIASGVSWQYLQEALSNFDLDVSTLKIDVVLPFPGEKVLNLLKHVDKVLILEEQEPIVETLAKKEAFNAGLKLQFYGKDEGTTSRVGENNFEITSEALSKVLGKEIGFKRKIEFDEEQIATHLHTRSLYFCPGCQHMATYYVINEAIRKMKFKSDEVIVTGDIGCTSLGVFKPVETIWTEVTMGAAIGMAHGFVVAGSPRPVIATLGDSTFFHSGLAPLINAVHHGIDLTVIVFDNSWTCMTGFQPNPNSGQNVMKEETKKISPLDFGKALGIDTTIIKPYEIGKSVATVIEKVKQKGVKLIVSQEECALQKLRKGVKNTPYWIDPEKCTNCGLCKNRLGCVAISPGEKFHTIDPSVCFGCGSCSQVCNFGAIEEIK